VQPGFDKQAIQQLSPLSRGP